MLDASLRPGPEADQPGQSDIAKDQNHATIGTTELVSRTLLKCRERGCLL